MRVCCLLLLGQTEDSQPTVPFEETFLLADLFLPVVWLSIFCLLVFLIGDNAPSGTTASPESKESALRILVAP
jgi:hypothetical protein